MTELDVETTVQLILREFVDDATTAARDGLIYRAPMGETASLLRNIDNAKVDKAAYGYIGETGIGPVKDAATRKHPEKSMYPLMVLTGTGIYGPMKEKYLANRSLGLNDEGGYVSPIRNTGFYAPMKFTWKGRGYNSKIIRGQKPNDYVTPAKDDANRWIIAHKRALKEKIEKALQE